MQFHELVCSMILVSVLSSNFVLGLGLGLGLDNVVMSVGPCLITSSAAEILSRHGTAGCSVSTLHVPGSSAALCNQSGVSIQVT